MEKIKILVVEDEAPIQELLQFNLERNKYRVKVVDSGEEALTMAGEFKPDLILLDIMLPGADGLEVCKQLKADSKTDQIPINALLREQALVNLIINGIKYSEPDKKVLVLAEKQANQVVIYIKDEGFGIEHRHLERLFERFYRVDTARSRKMGGTGLGLSIVKHIIQAHDGTIQVESKLGSGSTFTMTLPDKKI